MKRRSLVRIPLPPLVWTCQKKKKIQDGSLIYIVQHSGKLVIDVVWIKTSVDNLNLGMASRLINVFFATIGMLSHYQKVKHIAPRKNILI
jgi:hypothetical protein